MRYLFLISGLITILLTGCQSVKPRHLSPIAAQQSNGTSLPTANCQLPTLFSSPTFEKALFKASLDIGKHHLTGLVFVKAIPDTGYRVVFSNEFGMTYFDVETRETRLQINYCFEPLNKKMLWKILETDFLLLLDAKKGSFDGECFVQGTTNYLVYKRKAGNLKRWDIYNPTGDTLLEIRGKRSVADPALISFTNYRDTSPFRITLVNDIIKLKLSLSLISIN
ncbi:MAG: hypothetical protein IH596_09920 [Bacteroidales bacterium]|nr:hypothetical protein [Bacteroidales bacterium]